METNLGQLREELDTLQSKLACHQETKVQMEHSVEENRRKKERCRQSIGTLEERIRENTMTIRRLQDAKSDRLKGFGHWMPQIIQAINQCREFRRKPVGPLGMYLKVKEADHSWAFAVECAIGLSNLTMFFCDNHHDRQLLVRIIRQFVKDRRHYPETLVVPFTSQPYRDSSLAETPYKTVAQVLEVEQSNPLVLNYLLENRMNRTLLIANYNEARTFMFNKCPSDYGVAFTKEGHRAHRDHRCYSEKKQPRVVYLQASSDESLRDLQAEIQKFTAEKQEMEVSLQGISSQEDQDKRELARIRGILQDEKRRIDILTKKSLHVETELAMLVEDDEEEDEGIDVATLEEEIMVMDQEIGDIKEQVSSKKDDIKGAKTAVREAHEAVGSIQERIDCEMTETERLNVSFILVIQAVV
jgi:chromosome segregation ATPase